MTLFTKRKDEIEYMKKMCETMEGSQKNTELLVQSLCQMMMDGKQTDVGLGEFENEDEEKFEKIRAAYALNLCTVSVSQIVDYEDIHILEQEYETILNNLNLEHMPKDEALLSILRQLLDTITFFRIQEEEKKFVEKEYQQKMKNAIWAAVPNLGLIVAGGNPITMAVSLASQIGIGYMNYRKCKAENNAEKEKQEWQLQKTAIEQFNGLRRELFDTAWRLADRYDFPDEYRLTEKQISQYNQILMDTNVLRKYDRLDAIKDCFSAYPPFWYYYGHAANEIAQRALLDDDLVIYNAYRESALMHFRHYMEVNKYALLREDYITSSCALECIDLLDESKDRDEMIRLIEIAQKFSGRECDILQLCAIAYLKLGETKQAVSLLEYLVNEQYNDVSNAQLLSIVLVGDIIRNENNNYRIAYKMLSQKIPEELLFPLPEGGKDLTQLEKVFLDKQQDKLLHEYAYVIKAYQNICYIKFNKSVPVPFEGKYYDDEFFSENKIEERANEYKKVFNGGRQQQEFIDRINESDFILDYLNILNEMVDDIIQIIPYDGEEKLLLVQKLVGIVKNKIIKNKNNIGCTALYSNNPIEAVEKILKMSLDVFTEDFFKELISNIIKHVKGLERLDALSKEETILHNFCLKHNIPEFNLQNPYSNSCNESAESKVYFSSELLGGEAQDKARTVKIGHQMTDVIEKSMKLEDAKHTKIYTKWNFLTKRDFEAYFIKGRKNYFNKNKDFRMKIIAVIRDTSFFGKADLIFTTEGLFLDKAFTSINEKPEVTAYNQIEFSENKIHLKDEKYSNKEMQMKKLYELIEKLKDIAAKYSSPDIKQNEKDMPLLEDYGIADYEIENEENYVIEDEEIEMELETF